MSPRLPSVRAAKVVRALERDDWRRVGQCGSHLKLRKGSHRVTVPTHHGDVRPGTLGSILAQAALSEERFLELLSG